MLQRVLSAALALACAMAMTSSCTHVEVPLPGVLDLRSDARELDVDKRVTPAMKEQARDGMSAMMGGEGVRTSSSAAGDVVVEGRVWWLAALWRINDGDVDKGLRSVLGAKGEATALRNVVVTEEMTTLEALAFYCGLPIPCVDLGVVAFMPTKTVRAAGTRVIIPVTESAASEAKP